jgi:integrase
MTNTGMRPSEARKLQSRDVAAQTDKQGRSFVRLAVHGKGKHRNFVAASNVATYFDRVREISKATKPEDYVFTTDDESRTRTLYHTLIESMLVESKLLMGSSSSRRSTYCFRHTSAIYGSPRVSMSISLRNKWANRSR